MCHLGKWYIQTDICKWYTHTDIEGETLRIGEETQPKKQVTTKTSTKDTRHTSNWEENDRYRETRNDVFIHQGKEGVTLKLWWVQNPMKD